MKSGCSPSAALIWRRAALAQPAPDPLAPLAAAAQPTQPSQRRRAAAVTVDASPDRRRPAPVPRRRPIAVPKDWRGVFDAIDAGNWASAQAGIAALPPSILTPVAKAELYTAKGSPVGRPRLAPGADRRGARAAAGRPARADGAQARRDDAAADRPAKGRPYMLGSAPVRYKARPVQGEPAADQLRAALDPLVKADDAAGAEAQLCSTRPQLSVEARAEAAQRVAFVYYVLGLDLDARRVADTWRAGRDRRMGAPGGVDLRPRVVAPRRLRTPPRAPSSRSPQLAQQRELRAGGLLLGGARRAGVPAGRARSTPLLKAAARSNGKLLRPARPRNAGHGHQAPGRSRSSASIRRSTNCPTSSARSSWRGSASRRWPRKCFATRPRSARPSEHHALIQLAKRLDLPAAQLWLANNGQPGARSDAADRYPNPRWTPLNGWRVDPALAFGHIVQEFAFRRDRGQPRRRGRPDAGPARSPRSDMARSRGVPYSRADPDRPAATTSNSARASSR